MANESEINRLLGRWTEGDGEARDRVMLLVLEEVRRLARRALRGERIDHTLQATALVNEVYLRLVERRSIPWENRAHFLNALAEIIRCILVDHARARLTTKRGGDVYKVPIEDLPYELGTDRDPELVALDDSLRILQREDPDRYRIVMLRYFMGMTREEIVDVLGVSVNTISKRYSEAIRWLQEELKAT